MLNAIYYFSEDLASLSELYMYIATALLSFSDKEKIIPFALGYSFLHFFKKKLVISENEPVQNNPFFAEFPISHNLQQAQKTHTNILLLNFLTFA